MQSDDDIQLARERGRGRGRGNILLKLLLEKEKAENEAATESSQMKANTVKDEHPTPTTGIPICSTTSRGSNDSLDFKQGLKSTEALKHKPVLTQTQGRASILSKVKALSSLEEPPKQPGSPVPSQSSIGVLPKLHDLSLQDAKGTSESIYENIPRVSQKGTKGKQIEMRANYINLKLDPGKGLFNYEVKFNPDIDSRPLRRNLLNQHVQILGKTKVFDGALLYLPEKLEQQITTLESTHPMDGTKVTLTVIYKKKQSMSENIPFFNVLLGRVMRALSLVRIGQHNFNPKGIRSVPQHKLEVWPGYVTTINEYDGGLKLCIDARHRVMRTETVRDIMMRLVKNVNFKNAVARELFGMSVFTRYNNKMYRVDDIDWDKNPSYTFDKGGTMISLIDYYKYHWNLVIKDNRQPLLVHRAKNRLVTGETQETLILLVPELCHTASLSDSMRSDFRVMKDLDAITKMTPDARRDVCKHFIEEIQKNPESRGILAEWGLRLNTDIVEFSGRTLEPERIFFGNGVQYTPPPHKAAEWGMVANKSAPLRRLNLSNWYILHCQKDTRCTKEFVGMLIKVAMAMDISIKEPQTICLRDDRIDTLVQALRNSIQETVGLMVIIFPTNRTDKYSAVKRLCCIEMPIPSQVIISNTISRGDKLKSVTEKIMLQINCKLGGAAWGLPMNMEHCMICGIDVYHAGIGQSTKGSVAGFVASLDKLVTTWHSKICLQGKNQELIDMLQICFISALKAYNRYNKCYPRNIIVYRDGVGEGQIEVVTKYEVKQLLAALKNIEPSYHPTLTVIIVQKRINTRLFRKTHTGLENPEPGTIVDSYITKPTLYDFFLVSQKIRFGTLSPTHYIVVYDDKNMKPDHVQHLTYKLCHLYYNFTGTIKVPAPCQYAHKLVSLVGQHIQLEPHELLSNTLYYL